MLFVDYLFWQRKIDLKLVYFSVIKVKPHLPECFSKYYFYTTVETTLL